MGQFNFEHNPRLYYSLSTGGTCMETPDGTCSENVGSWLVCARLGVRIQRLLLESDIDYIQCVRSQYRSSCHNWNSGFQRPFPFVTSP